MVLLFVFVTAPFSLAQTVLVSNLAQSTNISYSIASPTRLLSTGFTTGTTGMSLTSATVALWESGGNQTAIAYLFSNNGGVPTSTDSGGLLATSDSVTILGGPGANFVLTFSSPPILSADTTYHLAVGAPSNFAYFVSTPSTAETGLTGWSIADNVTRTLDSGVTWAVYQSESLKFSLNGAAIPEPSTYAALFGLVALGFAVYRRRRRQAG